MRRVFKMARTHLSVRCPAAVMKKLGTGEMETDEYFRDL